MPWQRIFWPNLRFGSFEIHKVYLQSPKHNLNQNLSLPALAVCSKVPLVWR